MNIKKTILAVIVTLTMGFPAQASVLVTNVNNGNIGLYNETTGVAIKTNFIAGAAGPYGITHDSSGIFVANLYTGVVSKYDLAGAIINTFSSINLVSPTSVQVLNGVLYVATAAGTIGTYNATTGAAISSSLISVGGTVRSFEIYNNQLYVGDIDNNVVKTYGLNGSVLNANFTSFNTPSGFAFSGNSMFVTSANLGLVGEVNATTGVWFFTPITTGLSTPIGIAVNSDGNLLVANSSGSVALYKADGTLLNGAFLAGTNGPIGLDIIPVPEPSISALIFATGALFVLIGRRRSRKTLELGWSRRESLV